MSARGRSRGQGGAAASRVPLIAANWKMHFDHLEAVHYVQKLAWTLKDAHHDFSAAEVVLLPPFTDIRSVQTLVQADRLEIEYGAQDVAETLDGAFTGEVSARFLQRLGASYVLIGHSERRKYHDEDESTTVGKVRAALSCDMRPILCVGEALEARRAGIQIDYALSQVDDVLRDFSVDEIGELVIAYEPVWAIGTGEVEEPSGAQAAASSIREWIGERFGATAGERVRVLYGGSVDSRNAQALLEGPDVDGLLVGGASHDPDELARIVRIAAKVAA